MFKKLIAGISRFLNLEESLTLKKVKIPIYRLRVGVYIELQENSFPSLFARKSFIISAEKDIQKLKASEIDYVYVIPAKSEVFPYTLDEYNKIKQAQLSKEVVPEPEPETIVETVEEPEKTFVIPPADERKKQQKERNREIQRCEKQYKKTVSTVKNVMNTFRARPEEAIAEVTEMINDTVASLLAETDVVVNVMNEHSQDENAYFHNMNVSVLCLLLGKAYGLGEQDMKTLGMGALFHDIGKEKVADPILQKQTELTKPEFEIYSRHPLYGGDILRKVDNFPNEAIEIVEQHHEMVDGSGYPKQLKGEQIPILSRIVAIANIYDNLCNHNDINLSLTPAESVAHMFNHQKHVMDEELLELFIKCLGVYPPATIVLLSNGAYGMVISVNPKDSLNPKVILYSKDIPREEAIIFDMLDDKNIKIEKAIRPAKLPQDVYNYLNPRKHINYSMDTPNADKK